MNFYSVSGGFGRQPPRLLLFFSFLPPGPAATEESPFHIGRFYLNLDAVVDQGIYIDRSKRGVTTGIGVERGDADQPVHPAFCFQEAKGKWTVELDRGALDARAFPVLEIQFGEIPALF